MRPIVRILGAGALVLAVAGVARAQSAAQVSACRPGKLPVPADTLRALVRRLYPETVKLAAGDSLVTVGLVFDAGCRLTQHAIGRRSTLRMSVDTVFAQIMPGVRSAPWRVSGYATVASDAPSGAEIAFVVLRENSSRR